MANYGNLKSTIDNNIYENDNQEITGSILNSVLNAMVTSLGAGYQFMGIATPSTSPGSPDQNVFYLASEAGTYNGFGGTVLDGSKLYCFAWKNSAWTPTIIASLGASGGIPDAPLDGLLYGRKDGAWGAVPAGVSDAAIDGKTYGRKDGAWVELQQGGASNSDIIVPLVRSSQGVYSLDPTFEWRTEAPKIARGEYSNVYLRYSNSEGYPFLVPSILKIGGVSGDSATIDIIGVILSFEDGTASYADIDVYLNTASDATVNVASGTIGGGGGSYSAGDGIDITNNAISLKKASASQLGGVKVGSGVNIDSDGKISVPENAIIIPLDVLREINLEQEEIVELYTKLRGHLALRGNTTPIYFLMNNYNLFPVVYAAEAILATNPCELIAMPYGSNDKLYVLKYTIYPDGTYERTDEGSVSVRQASSDDLGIVKIGQNININYSGSISVNNASGSQKGLVRLGNSLKLSDANNTIVDIALEDIEFDVNTPSSPICNVDFSTFLALMKIQAVNKPYPNIYIRKGSYSNVFKNYIPATCRWILDGDTLQYRAIIEATQFLPNENGLSYTYHKIVWEFETPNTMTYAVTTGTIPIQV